MKESETLLISRKSQALRQRGLDVLSLGLGQPNYPTPAHIVESTIEDMRSRKYFSYSPVAGYGDLRAVIATKLREENNVPARPEEIVVSAGAKQCLSNVLLALVDPGDEVVIFSPYWVSYPQQVQLAGGKAVYLRATIEDDYTPSAEDLAAVLTPKTKLVMFSSPCNPTGAVFSRASFEGWAAVLAAHPSVFILSDEIYEYINFTGKPHESIGSLPALKDRTITVNGLSKGFAMTGWRLGYMHAPLPIARACEKIQGQTTSGANSLAQRACVHALTTQKTATMEMRDAYGMRCVELIDYFSELPDIQVNRPQGAYYLFPNVSHYFRKRYHGKPIANVKNLCVYLLEEGLVSVIPGDAFGDPNAIRVSFSLSKKDLAEGFRRLKKALLSLE